MTRENESFEVMTIRSEIQRIQRDRDSLQNRIEALQVVLDKITKPQPRNPVPVQAKFCPSMPSPENDGF